MNFPKRHRRRCPVLKAVRWRSGEHGCHSSLRAVSPPVHAGGLVCEGSWLAGWPFTGALHVRLQLTCGRNSSRRGRETLVSTKFKSTTTRGFASPGNPHVAVCLRPGTELAFENDVQTGGFLFRKKIGDRLAWFRQIALDQPSRHHDALEFSNGAVVLVTDLSVGQRATVLQLPASPMDEKIETPQPTARYEAADI